MSSSAVMIGALRVHTVKRNRQMTQLYVLFNSISVISGHTAGLEPGTARSVGQHLTY